MPLEKLPKSVVAVKEVSLVVVEYIDAEGAEQKQFCIVGDSNVHLLSGRQLGFSNTVAQGPGSDWLTKGIFEKLGRKK